jgi:hypothetical protein
MTVPRLIANGSAAPFTQYPLRQWRFAARFPRGEAGDISARQHPLVKTDLGNQSGEMLNLITGNVRCDRTDPNDVARDVSRGRDCLRAMLFAVDEEEKPTILTVVTTDGVDRSP